MKYLLPVVCSLLLIGCGDSAQTETTAAPQTPPSEAAAPASEIPATVPEAAPSVEPVAATPSEAVEAPAKPAANSSAASVDGGALFAQKCASCHGMKAEKAALGKSQVIAGWSEQQTKEALKGYQAGTYGKEMKGLMQGQAKALDDTQIDALAKHISAL